MARRQILMVTILVVLFVYWPIVGLRPYFVYTNSEGSGQTCRCTGSSEPSLLADVKFKSQIMLLDFLQSKLKGIKLFSLKCYLLYTRRHQIGVRILNTFPQTLYLHEIPFATLVLTVCKHYFINFTK